MGSRVILSLDPVKAFDSSEWHYLWLALSAFNIIRSLQELLNTDPRVKVKINERVSECFSLFQGTRQGCPLSSLLFALAVEPLAIAMRAAGGVRGFRREVEKISLYVDDIPLFLGDANQSLTTAMDIIKRFGMFSGLSRNWEKSAFLPVMN